MENKIIVPFNESDILKVEKEFNRINGRLPDKNDFIKSFTDIIIYKYPQYEVVEVYETENPFNINFIIKETMSLVRYAHIYYDAEMQRQDQLINIQNANQALYDYKNSTQDSPLERNLRLIQLTQNLNNEQHLYDERMEEVNCASLDLIQALKAINLPIGERKPFELIDNRYFEVYLEDVNTLMFLGPYSRA